MKKFRNPLIYLVLAVTFLCCSRFKNLTHRSHNQSSQVYWHLANSDKDSIVGIDLYVTNDSENNLDIREKIIVAVLDNNIDILHKDLNELIWNNLDEIAGNRLDDDNNGYIDDIHGWNFIGNEKGENNFYVNFETTRILQNLTNFKLTDSLSRADFESDLDYVFYKRVLSRHLRRKKELKDLKINYESLYDLYFKITNEIEPFFPNQPITVSGLDSLQNLKASEFTDHYLATMKHFVKAGIDSVAVDSMRTHYTKLYHHLTDIAYYDRSIQGDDPSNIDDKQYGSPYIDRHTDFLDHGTPIAGILKNMAIKDEIEIMPLAISCYGDEHDKDIALAIRYAVDNGAKVINMSFWKEFSQYEHWVHDAIKYAEEQDVLIVSIAGNDGIDIDKTPKYPNDVGPDGKEISDNFILAGASNRVFGPELKLAFSNYGKKNVDLFAPGVDIYTTAPNNSYTDEFGGTSAAGAITSGVAALIRSYYPTLSASQVKHILMDSGVEYTIEVATPTKDDPEHTTPFNQLSKSGKVLNAYNAFIMADSIVKKT